MLLMFTCRSKSNTTLFHVFAAPVLSTGCYFHVCHLMAKEAEPSYKKRAIKCCAFVSILLYKGMMFHLQMQCNKEVFPYLGASFNGDLRGDGGQKCQIFQAKAIVCHPAHKEDVSSQD